MRCTWGLGSRLLVAALVAVALAFAVTVGSAGATGTGPARAASGSPGAATGPATTAAPLPPPKAWLLVDADTGNVIDAGNDRVPLPPASLTKVVTALTAANLAPDTPVSISARAAAAPADKLMLKAGQVWTADEMLRALLLSSANDAAVALAENIGGTLEGFQPIFARTAMGLGMADNPVLMDPAGLDGPDGVDGGNLVSARDLAIAGRALLAVPSLAAIVATPVYYFDGPDNVHHRLTNHNRLFLTTYAGAIGVKTGYTKRAGGCLMAAARVGGRTMLAVVLRGPNPTAAAKVLLDKGFATPVSAEVSTDQLPEVKPAGSSLGDASPAAPRGSVRVPASASASSSSSASSSASASPARPGSVAAPATGNLPPARSALRPLWVVVGGALALVMSLILVAGRRRRRYLRRRRHSPRPTWPEQDRWAA